MSLSKKPFGLFRQFLQSAARISSKCLTQCFICCLSKFRLCPPFSSPHKARSRYMGSPNAIGEQIPHLQPEMYFLPGTRPGRKYFPLCFSLSRKILRSFFYSLNSPTDVGLFFVCSYFPNRARIMGLMPPAERISMALSPRASAWRTSPVSSMVTLPLRMSSVMVWPS